MASYMREHYDTAGIVLPKGEKQKIMEFARAHGMSMSELARRAISFYVGREICFEGNDDVSFEEYYEQLTGEVLTNSYVN